MKEYINYVKKLQAAHQSYRENPALETAIKIRDLDEIIMYMSALLIEVLNEEEINQLYDVTLN